MLLEGAVFALFFQYNQEVLIRLQH